MICNETAAVICEVKLRVPKFKRFFPALSSLC